MNRTEKITESCNLIRATEASDGNGYIYRGEETGEWFRVTAEELVILSDLRRLKPDEAVSAYVHWCNNSGEWLGFDKHARRLGLM